MDETYDYIVLGTGLKECILSGLMSISGKKVLHIDRNNFYGGKSTSMAPLQSLFDAFGVERDLACFKRGKDWNVDLIPKFLMADGKLVMLLIHTNVLRYMEFKQIEGSFVMQAGKLHKVPSTETEALSSGLMSLGEKTRFQKFLLWVMKVVPDDASTWNTVYKAPLDLKKDNITHAYTSFELEESTQNFVGHAMCLYPNDSYKETAPASEVIERIQLYSKSVLRYGKSPYVYPLYGLGELPQSFSRLSALYGGTYMLDKPVDEVVMTNGVVSGVRSGEETAKCSSVICDPSYAPHKVKKVGQVVRAICILNHPIDGLQGVLSAQIIIPQSEVNRKHDIYVSCVSHPHMVCAEGFVVVIVATTVETDKPHDELKPGLDLLGQIEQTFISVDDLLEPTEDGRQSQLFVSKSYDASTHFESTCADVLDMYERITGTPFDFGIVKERLAEWNQPDND